MTADPLVLLPDVDRATARLLTTASKLDDAALAAPSLLPGWTRGHVLAHVARNGDAYVNLLTWARTGVETPAYPSAEHRDADIAANADRPLADHLADIAAAAERFATAAEQLAPAHWAGAVRTSSGNMAPAATVPWFRLREVEVHHVDLDAGYTTADWPDAFVHRLLHELVANLAPQMAPARLHATDLAHELDLGERPAVTVSGSGHEIAAWLSGRSAGDSLTVTPGGPLPTVPTWK